MSFLSNLSALIESAEADAARGCGLSDVLFEKRLQSAYSSILDEAPDDCRDEAEAALIARGYDPDFISHEYQAKEGQCRLTGIDENCCPCGRHP